MAYTVEEAGVLLSLSRAQLYRLIDLGEIGTITVGRSRRLTARQLDAFLEARERENPLPAPLLPTLPEARRDHHGR